MPQKRKAEDAATMAWLTDAIGDAARSAIYCVSGCLPRVDIELDVEGLGPVGIPLKGGVAKQLMARCRTAPYGKGMRTLVDTKVRKTFELDPKKFVLGDEWHAAIADVTQTVAEQLGLPADRLESRLYKLLVYGSGGFFRSHRDSEKQNRMVGSLIVVLPTPFDGGELLVRHGLVEQRIRFAEAAAGTAPCYAAFYADCEHEVRHVTRGVRMALAYNLVVKPQRKRSSAVIQPTPPEDSLAMAIASGVAMHPARPLVFALEHHYTQRGLSLELLKGSDRKLADMIVPAAEKAECRVSLAQVERHLQQAADDGRFHERSRWSYDDSPPEAEIEIGETYQDELHGTQWADTRGKKQPWGTIPLDVSAIVTSEPLDEWKPTTEDYEGYTGNAGNTLDRWYHRAAIVVWRSEDHFEVLTSAGVLPCIPLFGTMVAKLAKTSKKRLENARSECLRFAHAIIARWPDRREHYWSRRADEVALEDFTKHLLLLHDQDTLVMFFAKVAEQDEVLPLKSLVVGACREFGVNAFGPALTRLMSPPPRDRGRHETPLRDIHWLSGLCCGRSGKTDADVARVTGELCAVAVDRFCEPLPKRSPYSYDPEYRRPLSVSERSFPWLVKALVAQERDKELSRVLSFVRASPKDFRLDDCQVPGLKSVISWSQKRFGSVPPLVASWLTSVREKLERVTSKPPSPPADWSRPAEVSCSCQVCAELNAFLADPAEGVGKISAREELRRHLIAMIRQHQCDVTHAVERQGSPFSLVLTKTTGSFARATKQYKADRKLLKSLPTAPQG